MHELDIGKTAEGGRKRRVLVTTSSFLDTPGAHRTALESVGYEVIQYRGPHDENRLRTIIQECGVIDGIICGEDAFSKSVLEMLTPHTKIISKYGVGLDKIDQEAARTLGIEVTNTPGVNHGSVTELAFGLMIALARRITEHHQICQRVEWRRLTGFDLAGKTLGIVGLGRVGKEMARRALAFNMDVLVYNTNWNAEHQTFVDRSNQIFNDGYFAERPHSITRVQRIEELLEASDIISLHMNLTKDNTSFFNASRIKHCKRGACLVNVSRGSLIDPEAVAEALRRGWLGGYAADVVDPEPIQPSYPLLGIPNAIITPHIGSRTFDSVARQGLAAVHNVVAVLGGKS